MTNDPDVVVRKHVIVNFIKRNNIRMRARQRNRNKSKESFRESLKQWHTTTRERLIRTAANSDTFSAKRGSFTPENRLNVDQTPCPFAFNTKRTYHLFEKGTDQHKEKVWISQPGSGLDKRQCTLQVCFRPSGPQPKLTIIFRGAGKRITDDEVQAWHPDVDVYFQEKAWADTKFSCDWVRKALSQATPDESKFVLFCDNLTAQCTDEFKNEVSAVTGVVWYGLSSATDLWQPVDSGYGELLKVLMSQHHNRWLDDDDNAERWYGNERPYTAKERRILISHWAGEAYKKLCSTEYDAFRVKIWQKTGCLMTADGTDDDRVQPEGLADYKLPPPLLLLDPATAQPSTNTVTPADKEPDDVDYDDQDMVPSDDTVEPLEDNEADRELNHPWVGRRVRGLYENGWFEGEIKYFNKVLQEYIIHFSDGSRDFVKEDNFNETDLYFC